MTKTITRHPDDATLLSFAAGSLGEALSAVVAAHVSMCGQCRAEVRDMERLGAALIETPAMAGSDVPFDAVPDLPLDGERQASAAPAPVARAAGKLPAPVALRYGLDFDSIAWKRLGPGVWHHRLALSRPGQGDLRLLRIAAGCAMPDHGHGGNELTLVLDGAYGDKTGIYARGDIQDADGEMEHQPAADKAMGCICLIASERPARFKSLVGRLMQTWTGM